MKNRVFHTELDEPEDQHVGVYNLLTKCVRMPARAGVQRWAVRAPSEPWQNWLRCRTILEQQEHESSIDPTEAWLRLWVGSAEARWRAYQTQQIEDRLAAIEHSLDERIDQLVKERVEEALAERTESRRRADALVQDVIAKLREKTKNVRMLPPEEAWKMIDFSTLYEADEE